VVDVIARGDVGVIPGPCWNVLAGDGPHLIKTGEKAPLKGIYSWVRNIDKPYCNPTANEKEIPLDQGDVAPPVRSCESAAVWQWARSY
jgi:hypothetical protein